MPPTIVIACATRRSVCRALSRREGAPIRWAYLGDNIPAALACRKWLDGKGQQVMIGELLQETTQKFREDYIEYIGALSAQYASPSWWLASLSEKNQYISKVFLRSCYVLLAEKIAREQGRVGILLFIVEDRSVRQCLANHFRAHSGGERGWRESLSRTVVDWLAETGQFLARRAWFVAKYTARGLAARTLLGWGKNSPIGSIRSRGGGLILVHSWVDSRCFDTQGRYHSINFGDLPQYLSSQGRHCVIVPTILPVMSFLAGIRALRRSCVPFLLPDLFLKPVDIMAAALAACRRPKASAWPRFHGVDISELILDDQRQDWVTARYPTNALLIATVRRWADAGIPVEAFIYTFENQIWEKAYCLAFRKYYPHAALVGYQDANLSAMALNFFIAKKEAPILPLPHTLVTNGRYSLDLLVRSGYDPSQLQCGGALRYQYLPEARDKFEELRARWAKGNGTAVPVVLVAMSVGKALSCELLWKVIQAFECDTRVRVVLKCHPYLPFSVLSGCLGLDRLPLHFEVSVQPVRELLPYSSTLLYMDSTTALEALAVGIPLVHVASDFGLDFDPLDEARELRRTARTPGQILHAVLSGTDHHLDWAERAQRGREQIAHIFGPMTESAYRCFLGVKAGHHLAPLG